MGELECSADSLISDSLTVCGAVLESECSLQHSRQSMAFYSMIYVTDGKGLVQSTATHGELSSGDIVICAPCAEWSIKNVLNLKYIRVTYFGADAKALASRFGLKMTVKQYHGIFGLSELWRSCISLPTAVAYLRCKGLIYYTFSEIEKISACFVSKSDVQNAAQRIKSFIDDNFTRSEMSLKYMSETLSYHSNYITSVFTREYHVSIVKYINILRVRHACFLMEQGITFIKDISVLCGYENSDYFSAVFKAQMGITPKKYIAHIQLISNQEH